MNVLKQYLEAYNDDFTLSVDDFIGTTEQNKIDSYFDSAFKISGEEAMEAGEYNASHDLPFDMQKQIVEDAKKGIAGAIFYCYYRMFPKMRSAWRMYVGQDAKHYIEKDKSEYYSLAYFALAGDFSKFNVGSRISQNMVSDSEYIGLRKNALEYTDLTKIGSMSPFQALAQQFDFCIRETIKQSILKSNSKGIVGLDNKADVMKGVDSKFISMDQTIDNDKSGVNTVGEKIEDEKATSAADIDEKLADESLIDEFENLLMGTYGEELYGDKKFSKNKKGHLPDDPDFSGISPLNVFKVFTELANNGEESASAVSKELAKRIGKSGIVQPATWGIWDKATETPGALGILKMACENVGIDFEELFIAAANNPAKFSQVIDDCAEPSWLEHPWGINA